MRRKLAFILGIRPDLIRAALILEHLRSYPEVETVFVWSGQHYSDNLKDIFFRELGIQPAQIDLGCRGDTDAQIAATLIQKLYPVLHEMQPTAAVFLGDTNTTTGAIAAAQLNIPIVHIEGGMRSYDWRMPEEKYRTVIDHLADVIYVYLDEYKEQAVREGIAPENVVVVGNPIVDVLEHQYFSKKSAVDQMATSEFFSSRGIERNGFFLMTCHRRENVENEPSLHAIIDLVGHAPFPVFFPASYRTQRELKRSSFSAPPRLHIVDPIGYDEFLCLMVNSRGVITDSGTVVEEACVLGVPSVQVRRSTERPQVYDVGSSVKFDPSVPSRYPAATIFEKLESLRGRKWANPFGDGNSSKRIADDLRRRLVEDDFRRHEARHYPFPVQHSYREDGLTTEKLG